MLLTKMPGVGNSCRAVLGLCCRSNTHAAAKPIELRATWWFCHALQLPQMRVLPHLIRLLNLNVIFFLVEPQGIPFSNEPMSNNANQKISHPADVKCVR